MKALLLAAVLALPYQSLQEFALNNTREQPSLASCGQKKPLLVHRTLQEERGKHYRVAFDPDFQRFVLSLHDTNSGMMLYAWYGTLNQEWPKEFIVTFAGPRDEIMAVFAGPCSFLYGSF